MMDLKVLKSALEQLEEEKKIPQTKIIEAIEQAMAAAYKKDYGKRAQVIRAKLDLNTGTTEFFQVKTVVEKENVRFPDEEQTSEEKPATESVEEKPFFNEEQHILIEDAKRMKRDAGSGDELIFPLEAKDDYGRIAAQTAKQVIMQKLREAERESVITEFEGRENSVVSGTVQRIERGNVLVDLGRSIGILPYEEQIPGERYHQGSRLKAYLFKVEDGLRGVSLRLSRTHPKFLEELFRAESPEIANGTVLIKSVAREPGSRSKIAVVSTDPHVDPVGSCVGQRGVRVSTITNELHGEKIDIIEWSADAKKFVSDALSPAQAISIEIDSEKRSAKIIVSPEEQSLAIGRGGQNVRLAVKLTGYRIDILGTKGENLVESDGEEVVFEEKENDEKVENNFSEVATDEASKEISSEPSNEDSDKN